jgi:hypothetical protein
VGVTGAAVVGVTGTVVVGVDAAMAAAGAERIEQARSTATLLEKRRVRAIMV